MLNRGRTIIPVVLTALAVGLLCVGLPILAAKSPKPPPPPPPPPGPAYSVAELKVPQGFTYSEGLAVNDLGQVVGHVHTAAGENHAALWETSSAALTDLSNGYHPSCAYAINNLGQVTGECPSSVGSGHPVVWIPDGQGGYEMTDLAPDAIEGTTYDINNSGVVVGQLGPEDGWVGFLVVPEDADHDGVPDTWFRDNGDGSNALMFEFVGTVLDAINDLGWVVGSYRTIDGARRAFLIIPDFAQPNPWFKDGDGDGVNDLIRLLPEAGSEPWEVNNRGQIIGSGVYLGGPPLWEVVVAGDGTVAVTTTKLPVPNGFDHWSAYAINDSGQVVGYASNYKGKHVSEPVLWQKDKGTMLLESPLSNMGVFSDLCYAWGINSLGQIAGGGTTSAGPRGYLASPVAP